MYTIHKIFKIAERNYVFVEGDTSFLKNGINLQDENGNIFILETVGMTKFEKVSDYKRYAVLLLAGDTENIGKKLTIIENH